MRKYRIDGIEYELPDARYRGKLSKRDLSNIRRRFGKFGHGPVISHRDIHYQDSLPELWAWDIPERISERRALFYFNNSFGLGDAYGIYGEKYK